MPMPSKRRSVLVQSSVEACTPPGETSHCPSSITGQTWFACFVFPWALKCRTPTLSVQWSSICYWGELCSLINVSILSDYKGLGSHHCVPMQTFPHKIWCIIRFFKVWKCWPFPCLCNSLYNVGQFIVFFFHFSDFSSFYLWAVQGRFPFSFCFLSLAHIFHYKMFVKCVERNPASFFATWLHHWWRELIGGGPYSLMVWVEEGRSSKASNRIKSSNTCLVWAGEGGWLLTVVLGCSVCVLAPQAPKITLWLLSKV